MTITTAADNILIFFFFLSKKISLEFHVNHCKVGGAHEMSRLIFSEIKKKKKIRMSSATKFAWCFFKNRLFFIQERFNKLIYSINTIIKCGI